MKTGRFANLGSNSIVFLGAGVLEALAPVILVPLLTHNLAPQDYGHWVLYVAIYTFLTPVIGFSLHETLRIKFFKLASEQRRKFTTTAVAMTIISTTCWIAAASPYCDFLSNMTIFPGYWVVAAVLTAGLNSCFRIFLAEAQFAGDYRRYLICHLIQVGVTLSSTVALLLLSGLSWEAAVIAKIMGLTAACTAIHFNLVPDVPKNKFSLRSFEHVREILLFGVHFFPAGLFAVIIPLTDRVYLSHTVGTAETAYFGVGANFAHLIVLFSQAFITAWQPVLFRFISKGEGDSLGLRRAALLFLSVLPLIAVAIWVLSLFVSGILIGKGYERFAAYLSWMTVAMVGQGYHQFAASLLQSENRVLTMSGISIVAAITNIVLNMALVKFFGGPGVAVATAISYGLAGTMALILVRRGPKHGRFSSVFNHANHKEVILLKQEKTVDAAG